ncbi:MAG: hypothetical protein II891_05500 [Bacteroidales bacterium]|nr:hypothetical protein [Bacteroidales bacterium]
MSVNVESLGIDWKGHYSFNGEELLSAALDVAGAVDPTRVADIANAALLYKNGDILGGTISAIGVISYAGDLAKLTRIGRNVRIITDAVSAVDRGGGLTKSLRKNMIRAYGGAPAGAQAHHILPKKFKKEFGDVGLNINDPQYGVWLESHHHLSNAREYNIAWEKFFKYNHDYTEEQVLEEAKYYMHRIYGK